MSLWRGYLVTVVRYFPAQAFNFSFNDLYNHFYKHHLHGELTGFKLLAANMTSGALAGMSSITLLYPLDYVRTRLAVDIGRAKPDRIYTSSFD